MENKEKDLWIHPWNITQFNNLNIKDERFFAILIKGVLFYLNDNVVLYNEPINHFIFNTGSSYLYVENNGYEYNLKETTGEDYIYMELPRCIVEINDINFDTEELTNPFTRCVYERMSSKDNTIKGYSAEVKRLPIELNISLKYVLSNFNESIILLEELINKFTYQRYFNITYLGKEITCSIEYPQSQKIEINKLDMSSKDPSNKTINLSLKICSNYPILNERTEIPIDKVIGSFELSTELTNNSENTDIINKKID